MPVVRCVVVKTPELRPGSAVGAGEPRGTTCHCQQTCPDDKVSTTCVIPPPPPAGRASEFCPPDSTATSHTGPGRPHGAQVTPDTGPLNDFLKPLAVSLHPLLSCLFFVKVSAHIPENKTKTAVTQIIRGQSYTHPNPLRQEEKMLMREQNGCFLQPRRT